MGGYLQIDERNRAHLLSLINWLCDEVLSACGDGDALWFSKYYAVADLSPLLEEVGRSRGNLGWHLDSYDGGRTVKWGAFQEGITVTNDEELFRKAPGWQQVLLRY